MEAAEHLAIVRSARPEEVGTVMYQQRPLVPEDEAVVTGDRWRPRLPDEELRAVAEVVDLEPDKEDAYVVVDDLAPTAVTLVVAPWPQLDEGGRLVFGLPPEGSPSYEWWRDLVGIFDASRRGRWERTEALPPHYVLFSSRGRFLSAVDRSRGGQGQLTRPLRVGDAFRVRGMESASVAEWTDIIDVTSQARELAKAALLGAVAPKMDREQATPESLQSEEPPPPPSGPVAGPSV
jgi:hypothetical protein